VVYSHGELYLSRLLVFPLMNCYPIWIVYGFEMFLAGGATLGAFLLAREWYRALKLIMKGKRQRYIISKNRHRWEDGRA
jgi:hypothetical protein